MENRGKSPKNFAGKIVIDVTNPLDFSKGVPPRLAVGHTDSAGEIVQRLLPESKVVKAFNSVGNPHMVHPNFPQGEPPTMFICGNDENAKKTITVAFLSPSPFVAPIFKKNGRSSKTMSLFPNEDVLTIEIELWKGFAYSLNSKEYKELFNKMLNDCYKYAKAINAKEKEPFPNTTESLIMALLLSQHKMIEWLKDRVSKL